MAGAGKPRWGRGARFTRQSLTAAALTLLVGAAALGVLGGEEPRESRTELHLSDTRVDTLMARYRCSTTGFGADVIPRKALLQRPDGRIDVVSFDRGWAAFTGEAPGTLVAVCLGKEVTGR